MATSKDMTKTKLGRLLTQMEITQMDFYKLIQYKTGKTIGMDRISNMVHGKLTNYNIQTARVMASTLGVKVDEIIE